MRKLIPRDRRILKSRMTKINMNLSRTNTSDEKSKRIPLDRIILMRWKNKISMNLSRTDTCNQKSTLMSELLKLYDGLKKSPDEEAVHSENLVISTIKNNSKYSSIRIFPN